MNKILTIIIFLIALVVTIGSTYIYFHCIYKPDVFNDWYEPFCYCLDMVASICITYELQKRL